MTHWATTLPEWADKYKTENHITQSFAASLQTDVERLSDAGLAGLYDRLPTPYRTSIYADFLEGEIIKRFCIEHAVGELV